MTSQSHFSSGGTVDVIVLLPSLPCQPCSPCPPPRHSLLLFGIPALVHPASLLSSCSCPVRPPYRPLQGQANRAPLPRRPDSESPNIGTPTPPVAPQISYQQSMGQLGSSESLHFLLIEISRSCLPRPPPCPVQSCPVVSSGAVRSGHKTSQPPYTPPTCKTTCLFIYIDSKSAPSSVPYTSSYRLC